MNRHSGWKVLIIADFIEPRQQWDETVRRQLSVFLLLFWVMLLPGGPCAAQAVRDVSPPWLTRPQQAGPPMHNLPPSSEEPATAPAAPPQTIRAQSSGEIEIDGTRAHLATIALPERTRLCPGERGSWACGAAAYIAWVNFFRAGNVRCEIKDDGATCFQNNRPVDEILVGAGWALPKTAHAEALRSFEEDAKKRQAGIHGSHR